MVFNEFLDVSNKCLGPIISDYEIQIQSLSLTNTAFKEFLIISHKNIGFLLKFYQEFSEQYRIFELRSLFATFESLKSVEFLMHTEFRNSNSKHFCSNASLLQFTL